MRTSGSKHIIGTYVLLLMLCVGVLVWMSVLSCEPDTEPRIDAPKIGSWRMLPVALVLSEALDPCQNAMMRAAATFWEVRTGKVLFDRQYVPASDPRVNGLPTMGVVAVASSPLSAPGVLDEATVVTVAGDPKMLYSVDLRVGKCSFRAYAHELGHALGLEHATGLGALMRKMDAPNDFDLSDTELLRAQD